MADETSPIDVSSLAELVRIKHDEALLVDRLEKMEARKAQVSAVVYRRVKTDYEARKAALEAEARSPRDRAHKEYAKLKLLRGEAERAVEDARFQKEELEFRHELGEFEGQEFDARLAEAQEKLAKRQSVLEGFIRLREDFVAAFRTEEELERGAASAPVAAPASAHPAMPTPPPFAPAHAAAPTPPPFAPARSPADEARDPMARTVRAPEPGHAHATPQPMAAAASPEATVVQPMPGTPPPRHPGTAPVVPHLSPPPVLAESPDATAVASVRPILPPPKFAKGAVPLSAAPVQADGSEPSSTLTMPMPRLIVLVGDRPDREYVLKAGTNTIGRSPESSLELPFADVSRHHANVVPSGDDGFKILDQGSPNGLFVNGRAVKEHLLADGDVIQVGRRRLLFRTT